MKTLAQQIKSQQAKSLIKLIGYFGSQSRAASFLDVSPQVVSKWMSRGRISAKMALKAQIITGNYISREDLRPDVMVWEK
jgi:DNA-binding transcriptional regulator YdaS (Cro superfamily)